MTLQRGPLASGALLLAMLIASAAAADAWRDVLVTIEPATSSIAFVAEATTVGGVAAACFSFTDLDAATLDRLEVRIEFRDADRRVLLARTVDRRGAFAQHVQIVGYTGAGAGTKVVGKAGQCVVLRGRAMTFPSDALQSVVIIPIRLHFTDGTSVDLSSART
jgi:hypothetical protein